MKPFISIQCRTWALIALIGSVASACTASVPAGEQTPSAVPSVVPSSTSLPTPQETPAPAPTAAPTSEPVKFTYRLNANYDVVPIDPNGNKKVVLLTFDDGPKELELNEKLLAALEKHRAKAIFFVNGYRVKQHPELLKLIHSKGQTIGNHSWDHIDLKKEKPEKVDAQIRDVQQLVRDTVGSAPLFFRPPYGSGSDYVKQRAKEEKLLYMTWSNGSEDWVEKYQNPPAVIKRVLEQLHNGSNILMHEVPWTADALDELITQLEAKGYSFVDPSSIETAATP
ncbi:polysaccharide deacetylase family protein [Paenibacillus sp. HJGM_3]|uniref:polysaccharide deacetylase family protein n=1 Tax=Paenibacillus sp. HJGM_3 TaxID=3379816 RepID=UPI00385945A5